MADLPSGNPHRSQLILPALLLGLAALSLTVGCAMLGAEFTRHTMERQASLDQSAREFAWSIDRFLVQHAAALDMAAAQYLECRDETCRAGVVSRLGRNFPAFESAAPGRDEASARNERVSVLPPEAGEVGLHVTVRAPSVSNTSQSDQTFVGLLRLPVPPSPPSGRPPAHALKVRLLLLDATGQVLYPVSNGGDVQPTLAESAAAAAHQHTVPAPAPRPGTQSGSIPLGTTGWRVVAWISDNESGRIFALLGGSACLPLLCGLLLAAAGSINVSRLVKRERDILIEGVARLEALAPAAAGAQRPALAASASVLAALSALGERQCEARTVAGLADDALGRNNRELALRLQRREAQMLARNDELERALDAAKESIRTRDALLANTSHEIRTPLYGIVGSVELLRPRLSDREDLRDLGAIMQSAESLMQLINDLLDFSRINAGALIIEAKPFSLVELARNVLATIQPLADKRALSLHMASRLDAGVRRGDELRVRQVLLNLLGNAVKFTERGSVRLELDGDDKQVRILVADTGVGIAGDDMERIFRPFEQADASMRRRFQGTGLGLAIVDRLVLAMGGRIEVDSVLGKGSNFLVALPLPATSEEPPVDDAVLAPVGTFHELRVLVVDDVELNRMLLRAQLERLGVEVMCAADGYEALTLLARERVDLVLLDVQMPGIDGLETAERMRGLPNGRDVRIVAVTANALPGERENCLAASMDDHVTKPLRVATLRRLLAEAVAYRNA